MRHYGGSASENGFSLPFLMFLLTVFFGSHFFSSYILPWKQAAELNASFGWSMRPGNAQRPLSLSLQSAPEPLCAGGQHCQAGRDGLGAAECSHHASHSDTNRSQIPRGPHAAGGCPDRRDGGAPFSSLVSCSIAVCLLSFIFFLPVSRLSIPCVV
jgi:hypothetical protein